MKKIPSYLHLKKINKAKLKRALKAQTNPARGFFQPISGNYYKKYFREIMAIVNPYVNGLIVALLPILERRLFENTIFVNEPIEAELRRTIELMKRRKNATLDQLAELKAKTFGVELSEWHKVNLEKAINKSLGVSVKIELYQDTDVRDLLKETLETNVGLITKMTTEQYSAIERVIFDGLASGNQIMDFKAELQKIEGMTLKRARLIARDQTAKLNASLDKIRQQKLGVSGYYWRGSEDERERDTHWDNNDKWFSWDDPNPETGHPGDDIQCRCYAEPDLSGFIELYGLDDLAT